MIKRVLLTTLVGLLAYSWFIHAFGPDINRTGQTAEQRNMVKAEEFLYEASAQYDTIIVGSSMGDRLITDSLSAGYYNLSLAGLSAHDGLRLIELSRHKPKILFVEINTLTHEATSPLVQTIEDPIWNWLKRYLPFTRQKYQPAGVFKAFLRDWRHGKGQVVTPESAMYVDSNFLNKTVAERMEKSRIPPPDSIVYQRMRAAYGKLENWRQQGVQVILFEMPVDPRLQNLYVARQVREAAQKVFPSPAYAHITLPAEAYRTTDGVHLTVQDAGRFTVYMRQCIIALTTNRYLVRQEHQ